MKSWNPVSVARSLVNALLITKLAQPEKICLVLMGRYIGV